MQTDGQGPPVKTRIETAVEAYLVNGTEALSISPVALNTT